MKKEEKKVEEKMHSCSKLLMTLMMICVLLSIATLGIVVYDKFIRKDEKMERTVLKPIDVKCEASNNNSQSNGVSINSLREIKLTNTNQTVRVGNKELKLRIGKNDIFDNALFINDSIVYNTNGEAVYIENTYVTDKYVMFATIGQCGNHINYAIDENGNIITVNNNDYQLNDLQIKDNKLYANGMLCRGEPFPESNVIIKYIDHTLIVTPAN